MSLYPLRRGEAPRRGELKKPSKNKKVNTGKAKQTSVNCFSIAEDCYKDDPKKLEHYKKQREEQGYKDDDKFSLNAYSDYLIICYKSCLNTLDGNYNKEAIIKTKNEMTMLEDNFTRNFNRDIKKFI